MAERANRLPTGFRVRLGPDVHRCTDGATLFGGSNGRIVRLKQAALVYLDGDGVIEVSDVRSEVLARLLADRGLAHPWWPDGPPTRAEIDRRTTQLTVVVPVLNRATELERLLRGLRSGGPPGLPIIVVDDGSTEDIRAVGDRYAAHVVRHATPQGPAAARNSGLAHARTELVAMIDSDVVLESADLARLARHFDDPRVGAVAPRVLGLLTGGGAVSRYEAACSSLDLGPTPALVRPHTRVSYVPSATLVVRRSAVGAGFDASMPVAEDVDFVWRLARDWHVRYDPGVAVRHDHRTAGGAWLRRKAFYGTGAAPLATRHGSAVAPVVLSPWTAALAVALVAQRRWSLPVAALAVGVGFSGTFRQLRSSAPAPAAETGRSAAALVAIAVGATVSQTGDAVVRHYVPLTIAALPFSARARRAALAAVVLGGVARWRRVRPELDPLRFVLLNTGDHASYGIGLWRGVVTERSAAALWPLIRDLSHSAPASISPRSRTKVPHPNVPNRKVVPDEQQLVRNGRRSAAAREASTAAVGIQSPSGWFRTRPDLQRQH